MTRLLLALLSLAVSLALPAGAQVFRTDDPLRVDRDDLPSPRPKESRVEDWYDGLENLFAPRGEQALPRAHNINTLGQVPDSSWFTNRVGPRELDRAALVRGPNRGTGPAPGTWTVVKAKSRGVTPGFNIKDSRGDTYVVKFDPPGNPEMATAAEIINTKLFHAMGYNVPENYIVNFRREDLEISPSAKVTNVIGKKLPMTESTLDALLRRVAKRPDGSMRALASKFLPGRPIGPFLFHGTRGDDLNDIFPHEHRRELRGYYVPCAWLNHDDSRSINTLDIYVGDDGAGHVQHFLIDFGSTLGSGSVKVQSRRAGNEYILEWTPVFKALFSLGLWQRPWIGVHYDELESVGRFESDFFTADGWRPEYPNVAFDHMDLEDAFWGASLVMQFDDADIKAVVAAADLTDPAAAALLVDALIERRDKIGRHWLRQLSSLADFRFDSGALAWRDLLVVHGFETATPATTATVHRFDNASGERVRLTEPTQTGAGRYLLPQFGSDGGIYVVTLATGTHEVDVFVRGAAVIGVDRRAPRRPALEHSKLEPAER